MEKEQRHVFYSGQKVHSETFGFGIIAETDRDDTFKIVVDFNGNLIAFNKYGWYNKTTQNPRIDISPVRSIDMLPDSESTSANYFTDDGFNVKDFCIGILVGFPAGGFVVWAINHFI